MRASAVVVQWRAAESSRAWRCCCCCCRCCCYVCSAKCAVKNAWPALCVHLELEMRRFARGSESEGRRGERQTSSGVWKLRSWRSVKFLRRERGERGKDSVRDWRGVYLARWWKWFSGMVIGVSWMRRKIGEKSSTRGLFAKVFVLICMGCWYRFN